MQPVPYSIAPLIGGEEHEACCSDAVSVLAVMRSLEARLNQGLEVSGGLPVQAAPLVVDANGIEACGSAEAGGTAERVAAPVLPVLATDLPLQVVSTSMEVKEELVHEGGMPMEVPMEVPMPLVDMEPKLESVMPVDEMLVVSRGMLGVPLGE